MSQRIQAVRGMNDVVPPASGLWQQVRERTREVVAAYGYDEVILPIVERTELFKRAVGEVTDVVEKEMYAFEDRSGESLALRPEGTAGCVRAGIEHGLLHNQQQRFWYFGPMFRHERPQAGRYRQFHQIGVEAYGMAGPDIDVEVIALGARLLRRLGFKNLRLELNSLGTPETRVAYRAALVAYLRQHESALDEDSRRRIERNPLRVLDSKAPATQALLADAPSILDHLDSVSQTHFDGLQQGLADLGIGYVLNPRLVRGLDYYSHGVFEWITTELGAQGTVCAGGRYDGLVQQLGGGATPAVGFASGVERLVLLLEAQGLVAATGQPQVYVCSLDEAAQCVARQECEQLRDAMPQLRLLVHAGGGSLKSQMRRANASGARYAFIIGSDEIASGAVQVKSLRGEGEPETVSWRELPSHLATRLAAPPPTESRA